MRTSPRKLSGAVVIAAVLSGCSTLKNLSVADVANVANAAKNGSVTDAIPNQGDVDYGKALDAGMELSKAVTLSDEDVKKMALQFAKYSDSKNTVAAPSSRYQQRLERLTKKYQSYDGLTLKYKVYISPEINAFALADGNIRVYSGLMDKMKDDELLGVIGHEIGHVKLQHSDSRMRLAYTAAGVRKGVASSGGVAGVVADSDIGGLFVQFLGAQFSQSQEQASDSYGLEFLLKNGQNGQGAINALYKLAKLDESSGSGARLLSSHPDPLDRARRLAQELADVKKNPDRSLPQEVVKAPPAEQNVLREDEMFDIDEGSSKSAALSAKKSPAKSAPVDEEMVAFDAGSATTVASDGSWYIQVSAETENEAAATRKGLLEQQGFSVTTQNAVVHGRSYIRVLVGPYASKRAAKAQLPATRQFSDGEPFMRALD